MPSDAVAVAAAPFGTRVAAAFASGRVAVYEGEANAGERFALEAELIGGYEEEETSTSSGAGGRGRTAAAAELSWFDAGAGCALLAVGVGSAVAAYARIPSRDGTALTRDWLGVVNLLRRPHEPGTIAARRCGSLRCDDVETKNQQQPSHIHLRPTRVWAQSDLQMQSRQRQPIHLTRLSDRSHSARA